MICVGQRAWVTKHESKCSNTHTFWLMPILIMTIPNMPDVNPAEDDLSENFLGTVTMHRGLHSYTTSHIAGILLTSTVRIPLSPSKRGSPLTEPLQNGIHLRRSACAKSVREFKSDLKKVKQLKSTAELFGVSVDEVHPIQGGGPDGGDDDPGNDPSDGNGSSGGDSKKIPLKQGRSKKRRDKCNFYSYAD